MNNQSTFAMAAALMWASAGCVPAAKMTAAGEPALDAASRRDLAERVSSGWAETPRLAARLMMTRYGPPDVVGMSRLIWHGNGSWKRTIVRDLPRLYGGAADEDLGVIEQTVSYSLTPDHAAALRPFGGRLAFDAAAMEMSSRSDREEVNCLRLNLANDVLRGVLNGQDAKAAYARILELEASGKSVSYMQGLTFGPGRPGTPRKP